MERQRMESRYLLVLQGLENELEEYKKKYSKLENKILPLMDQDSVRLKVLNEVESTHQM
jgi:archaellum component FlaC